MRKFIILLALASVAAPVWAATRTITLSIPSMYCPACPITVKQALTHVAGVSKVVVSLAKKDAVVTYDDAKTNVEQLIQATRNAGYPSSVAR